MSVGSCMCKRKFTLQVARVMSEEGGRIKALVVRKVIFRCCNGIKMGECIESARLEGICGGVTVYI